QPRCSTPSPHGALGATARALAMTTRDALANERGRQGGAGGREVRPLVEPGFERPLCLAACLLGPLEVDLRRHVRGLGHDHDLVRADLDEATRDRERLLRAAGPVREL